MNAPHPSAADADVTGDRLVRRLGTLDAVLIVMGGIVGSGIFMNPSVVARYVQAGSLVLLAWIAGGIIALAGAAVFAELAARRPLDGGLYAYLRDAYHPVVAFCYGWTLLLVSQSGGAAASAVTFASYLPRLLPHLRVAPTAVAVAVIALFTAVNCLGVRAGAGTQNGLMAAKIVAILGVVAIGTIAALRGGIPHHAVAPPHDAFAAFGLALVPVLFAYSGWQTSSFMTGELRRPDRTLVRGLLLGVAGVCALYLAVNAVCLAALGASGLARTTTPASDVVRLVLGAPGERIMAGIIALSTLGFIGNQILTAPRVYRRMAADRTFFPTLAAVHPRTHVPVLAIALQGIAAIAITLSGRYDVILNWVTSVDYVFFGLAAVALLIFRSRDARGSGERSVPFAAPLQPLASIGFALVAWAIVADVILRAPGESLLGLAVLLSGVPAYLGFRAYSTARR